MQACTLAGSGATLGATTIVLTNMLDINGVQLTLADFGQKGYATLEPSNGSQEEQISFTSVTANANGTTTLGGVKTVLFKTPFTESSGLAKSHPGGSKLIITNTAAFYTQFAVLTGTQTFTGLVTFTQSPVGINPGGSADASTTVKGIGEVSVAPVSATIPIFVGDNDPRVPTVAQVGYIPTSDQKAALAGSYGTPGVSNKYVTATDQTGSNLPAGAITMYGGAAAPTGWLLCDGTSYLNASYSALYSAISTTYGSADGSHFNVPDLRGRVPLGAGTGIGGGKAGHGLPASGATLSAWTPGAYFGEEKHQLTVAELASHTHTVPTYTAGGSGGTVNGGNTGAAAVTTNASGSDGSHNTIQPIMCLSFIIKT